MTAVAATGPTARQQHDSSGYRGHDEATAGVTMGAARGLNTMDHVYGTIYGFIPTFI